MNANDENFLAKEIWWWRPDATHRPIDFNLKNSLAFNYELVRRVYREEKFVPFYSLKIHHLSIIWPLSDDKFQQPVSRETYDLNRPKENDWTDFKPGLQWNLNASNKALQRAFSFFIQQQRELKNISKPRPNAGRRNKPPSWRWLELMDLADLNVGKLNDTERSQLSSARKIAKAKAEKFVILVDEYHSASEPDDYPFDKGFDDEPDFFERVSFSTVSEKPFGKGFWPRE